MMEAYNSIVMDISVKIPLFEYCLFKEIHYCINFHLKELDYPYTTEQVMKLFKCGYIPPHYKEFKKRCEKSHRMKSFDHSFYLISKSVVVNCYEKQAESKAKQEKYKHYDFSSRIETADGIIRFEIQCKYHKICNMVQDIMYKTKYSAPLCFISPSDLIKILLSDAMAKQVIYNYFSRILGLGDYYSLPKAKAKLNADLEKAKKSGDMDVHTIAMMNIAGFSSSLTALNKLNINPVTIPRDEKIPFMPNLLKAYLDMNNLSEEDMKIGMTQLPIPFDYTIISI